MARREFPSRSSRSSSTRYHSTLSFLYGLQYRGMKLGLRNVRALSRAAGHPEREFPSIHVAGTNGKGSTSSFIASCFNAAGYRTGLYTSPHLQRFNERIRIDGREIGDADIVRITEMFRPAIERTKATFFEATTMIAFRWFAEQKVDVAVIETGLGGRLDATNIVRPMVSVITNVALDHQEYLGKNVRDIAREKGGIIKPRVPVVTAAEDPEVIQILRMVAARRGSRFYEAAAVIQMRQPGSRRSRGQARFSSRAPRSRRTPSDDRMSMWGQRLTLTRVRPGLPGEHQKSNARLAVAALDVLLRAARFRTRFARLNSKAISKGIEQVRTRTNLRGRLQRAGPAGRFLLDVAHNPHGMKALVASLKESVRLPIPVIFGVLRDKDYRGMLKELLPVAGPLIAVSPRSPRALASTRLNGAAKRMGFGAVLGGTVASGIRKAGKGQVLITGSHYVVGEACSILRADKA